MNFKTFILSTFYVHNVNMSFYVYCVQQDYPSVVKGPDGDNRSHHQMLTVDWSVPCSHNASGQLRVHWCSLRLCSRAINRIIKHLCYVLDVQHITDATSVRRTRSITRWRRNKIIDVKTQMHRKDEHTKYRWKTKAKGNDYTYTDDMLSFKNQQ